MYSSQGKINLPFPIKVSKFFSVLGIVPFFDFKKQKLIRKKLFKLYALFLAFAITSLTIGLFYLRWIVFKMGLVSPDTVLSFLGEMVSLAAVSVTILGAGFWNMDNWKLFYMKNVSIARYMGSISPVANKVFITKYFRAIFITGNLHLLAVYVIECVAIKQEGQLISCYTADFILAYYNFLISFDIITIVSVIRCEYMCLNQLLKECNKDSEYIMIKLKSTRKVLIELNKIVHAFNNVYGWPMAILFLEFVLVILSSLVHGTNTNFNKEDKLYFVGVEVIILSCIYLLQNTVWLTAIIFCCDSVAREADDLLTNCYRLEQTLPMLSKEFEELQSLKRLIINKRPKLTAAGFFEIKRSTLLSLLSTTTTYFIVALQFNSL